MRLNAKGTVGSFGGRKLIYDKIITRKMFRGVVKHSFIHSQNVRGGLDPPLLMSNIVAHSNF